MVIVVLVLLLVTALLGIVARMARCRCGTCNFCAQRLSLTVQELILAWIWR